MRPALDEAEWRRPRWYRCEGETNNDQDDTEE